MKRLPIGIQTFADIRNNRYCYADKTAFICQLVEQGKFYFLSRPRRFGKSLLIDTIAEAFLGNKELFTGLHLDDKWDWQQKRAVIKIDFAQGVLSSRVQLDINIREILNVIAESYDIGLELEESHLRFAELIRKLHKQTGQQVVVLVDEYDKPILDNITDTGTATELRDGLKNFYSVLKAQGAHLHFVMLTGVSKFSEVSLFSGLNNLKDITLDQRFGAICGYTQNELESVFDKHIDGVDLEQVKRWYNGYSFLSELVYNPFDVLLYLDSCEFRPYWFETGTPDFLIKLLKTRRSYIPSFASLTVGSNLLGSFDVDFIAPETLLFQTGYLTIKEVKQRAGQIRYRLGYPNLEVRTSLTDSILNHFVPDIQKKERCHDDIYESLEMSDMPRLERSFSAFFDSIPNDWYSKNDIASYEGYYCSVVYCYFAALGIDVRPEESNNQGRIDMTVILDRKVYIIEFKINELTKAGRALNQIKEKNYHKKFRGKETYLIGVEFSKSERNISRFEWERVVWV